MALSGSRVVRLSESVRRNSWTQIDVQRPRYAYERSGIGRCELDNGDDLFTKTLSSNEIQSHIHKLSSQFVQNEINVNFVGARPNGVNLPRVLQELDIACDRKLAAWTQTDMSSRTRRKTMKGGPSWSDVVARVTADAVSGEILDSELARDLTRSLEHTPLGTGPRDIQTVLIFEASKVRSPSPILQDSVQRRWSAWIWRIQ